MKGKAEEERGTNSCIHVKNSGLGQTVGACGLGYLS